MLRARNTLNKFITLEIVFQNRVLEIESMIVAAESEKYEEEGVVAVQVAPSTTAVSEHLLQAAPPPYLYNWRQQVRHPETTNISIVTF